MNSTSNIVISPKMPAAERSTGTANANNNDEASQVRFAEVLQEKRARNAEAKSGSKDAKEEPSGAQKYGDESGTTNAAAADSAAADAAATPQPVADPAIAALLLDPTRVASMRAASVGTPGGKPGIGGFAETDAAANRPEKALNASADLALPPGFMPVAANTAATPGLAAGLAGAATSAATGPRAEPRTGATPLPASFEAAGSAGTAGRIQLPFGMAADSASRGDMPTLDAGRTDAAAWSAFAVPVDTAVSRQTAPAPLPPIEAPVGSPRFVDETAQQVTWLVKNGLSEAEIRVKPADMGPISVRIEMNQNEATLSFAVTQAETRGAVQDSLHRLTEMLAESGISLGEANVGGENFNQQPRDGGNSGRNRVTFAPGRGDTSLVEAGAVRRTVSAGTRGLVDTFA